MPATIYLHWAATPYTWLRSGIYHTIISGSGTIHRLHSYSVDLPAHTWRRNSNAVALSCACMGGQPDPWLIPPTAAQIEALCQETAAVARSWGWQASAITLERVMTHAEAAANRDGRQPHDNYGPVIWGGTGERWDLLQLQKNGPPTGGEQLRQRIRELLQQPSSSGSNAPALQFQGSTHIQARGEPLAVTLDQEGRSWALAVDLLERYDIPYTWEASRHRLLIGSRDLVPSFQSDQVQPSVGWPLFDMALQSGDAPVILRGVLREHRAWCRVLEFAEEFGISVQFNPFTLLERRGG
jgi:hypothetical protein